MDGWNVLGGAVRYMTPEEIEEYEKRDRRFDLPLPKWVGKGPAPILMDTGTEPRPSSVE